MRRAQKHFGQNDMLRRAAASYLLAPSHAKAVLIGRQYALVGRPTHRLQEHRLQITIANVLTATELADVRVQLAAMAFEDGRLTAGWNARLVKNNHQASASGALSAMRDMVSAAILRHPVFDLAVRPKALTPLLFSRTGVSEWYGTHVDSALMDGMRTDVAFTLFLSDPGAYDGGALVIESAAGDDAHKLPAGHIVVYPATALHRVETVTRGERLVVVGWARSHIRDAADRELLFDLDTARRRIFDQHGKTAEFDLLSKCLANLMRRWVDD